MDARWRQALWAVREVDHLFARLGRYTRFVMYSKWSLLGVAGLLVVVLIAWPLLTRDGSGIRVSFVDPGAEGVAPTSPVMRNPQYSGVGNKGQQYRIDGKSATQVTPELVVIDEVVAQMRNASGAWYGLSAQRADYRQLEKRIDLSGEVTVKDARGMQFVTSQASIDTASMYVVGNQTITGSGPLGNLVASGFEIIDNGDHIRFVGGEEPLRVTILRKRKNV